MCGCAAGAYIGDVPDTLVHLSSTDTGAVGQGHSGGAGGEAIAHQGGGADVIVYSGGALLARLTQVRFGGGNCVCSGADVVVHCFGGAVTVFQCCREYGVAIYPLSPEDVIVHKLYSHTTYLCEDIPLIRY